MKNLKFKIDEDVRSAVDDKIDEQIGLSVRDYVWDYLWDPVSWRIQIEIRWDVEAINEKS